MDMLAFKTLHDNIVQYIEFIQFKGGNVILIHTIATTMSTNSTIISA